MFAVSFPFSGGDMLKAVLFDIDGTLVDSVDIHAMAWQEALRHFGFSPRYEDVRSQVGKGSDKLIPEFVPESQLNGVQQKLADFRGDLFKRKYLHLIRPLSCVPELMQRVTDAGLRIALASSAKKDEVAAYVKLTDIRRFVREESSNDDVDDSKPSPDIFQAALHKLKDVRPDEAIAIGDTPYDAVAARRAGMQCIGVLTGGWRAEQLREAGCVAIYRNVAELFAMFDASPLAQPDRIAA
jgi:HAD superfamily hydrolase (TIGR01509 family)